MSRTATGQSRTATSQSSRAGSVAPSSNEANEPPVHHEEEEAIFLE